MHVIAHRDCVNTVGESALEVDSGRKIPCHIRELSPHQNCIWLFGPMHYKVSYPTPRVPWSTGGPVLTCWVAVANGQSCKDKVHLTFDLQLLRFFICFLSSEQFTCFGRTLCQKTRSSCFLNDAVATLYSKWVDLLNLRQNLPSFCNSTSLHHRSVMMLTELCQFCNSTSLHHRSVMMLTELCQFCTGCDKHSSRKTCFLLLFCFPNLLLETLHLVDANAVWKLVR